MAEQIKPKQVDSALPIMIQQSHSNQDDSTISIMVEQKQPQQYESAVISYYGRLEEIEEIIKVIFKLN